MQLIPSTPPDLRQRVGLALLCERDPDFREALRAKCAEDVAFFTNCFLYTFDPRPDVDYHDIPFILYPFQEQTLRWFDQRLTGLEDGIIEKSRDMGVTWVTMAWLIHGWLFRPGFQALIGSRKEDYVDNGTLDSHFGKLEYLIKHLPGWLIPEGFRLSEHRTKLKLRNPANGNVIIGESANAQFSRAGRYRVVIFDEAAFWEDLESSWRAAGQATRTRIAVSTPNGQNAFYRLRFALKESGEPMYPVLTLHVRDHPKKGQEWLDREKNRMSTEDFAQEIDISYQRSVRGQVYPEFVLIPDGHYPYKEGWSLYTSWDFGVNDDTAIIWWARNPVDGKLRMIDAYSNRQKPIDFYVPFVLGYIPAALSEKYQYTHDELKLITEHASWPQPIHFGDPAGNQRNAVTGTSVIDALRQYGIYVFTNDRARDFRSRKGATELGLRQIEGINSPNCAAVIEALRNAKFPERNPDSRSTSENILPVHDWTSHYRSAVEYLFVNLPPLHRTHRPNPRRHRMAYDRL